MSNPEVSRSTIFRIFALVCDIPMGRMKCFPLLKLVNSRFPCNPSVTPLSTMLALSSKLNFAFSCLSLVLAGPVDVQFAPKFNRTACQLPTINPLLGCPAGTLLVGPSGNYKTIQSAVAALPNNTISAVILIQAGNYTEQVNVTRAAPVYLLGQTSNTKSQYENRVNVIWRAVAGTGDNAFTATLTVAPNLNADLTGAGPTGFTVPSDTLFGNTDFRAYNLNLINDFAPYSDGPSLTLSMGYANAGFYQCQFLSYQDTVGYNSDSAMSKIGFSRMATADINSLQRCTLVS